MNTSIKYFQYYCYYCINTLTNSPSSSPGKPLSLSNVYCASKPYSPLLLSTELLIYTIVSISCFQHNTRAFVLSNFEVSILISYHSMYSYLYYVSSSVCKVIFSACTCPSVVICCAVLRGTACSPHAVLRATEKIKAHPAREP